jgi:hypothetical protein
MLIMNAVFATISYEPISNLTQIERIIKIIMLPCFFFFFYSFWRGNSSNITEFKKILVHSISSFKNTFFPFDFQESHRTEQKEKQDNNEIKQASEKLKGVGPLPTLLAGF